MRPHESPTPLPEHEEHTETDEYTRRILGSQAMGDRCPACGSKLDLSVSEEVVMSDSVTLTKEEIIDAVRSRRKNRAESAQRARSDKQFYDIVDLAIKKGISVEDAALEYANN